MGKKRIASGFTITELLIVIIVIAVLALIAIMSYQSVQRTSHDAAVQADLKKYADGAEGCRMYECAGSYPRSTAQLDALNVKATQDSYLIEGQTYNLYYCAADVWSDKFVFAARSKSGTLFYVTHDGNGQLGNVAINSATVCNIIGLTYGTGTVTWQGYVSTNVPKWSNWAT